MKNRLLSLLSAVVILLSGCAAGRKPQQYQETYLDVFDTVTTLTGYAESQEAFSEQAQKIHQQLLRYHQLFDIYHDYEDQNNLKTINDNAGIGPVAVDADIIRLLTDCRDYGQLTMGRTDVTMGSVLELWHEAREAGLQNPDLAALPEKQALRQAAEHTGWETVIIAETAGTVWLTDPDQQLDVGAVAKGWATQRAAEIAPEGWLLSVGGNVCATGPKDDAGSAWIVGIHDPKGGDQYLHTLRITSGSVVTSGDYQRYYTVDGVRYHHIIDPDTWYPSELWSSVTVVCDDSGLADALSTALFLLPQELGQTLLEACDAEGMWVDSEGNCAYSPGFENLICQ